VSSLIQITDSDQQVHIMLVSWRCQ